MFFKHYVGSLHIATFQIFWFQAKKRNSFENDHGFRCDGAFLWSLTSFSLKVHDWAFVQITAVFFTRGLPSCSFIGYFYIIITRNQYTYFGIKEFKQAEQDGLIYRSVPLIIHLDYLLCKHIFDF